MARETILCVDDEAGVLAALQQQLSARFGHECDIALAQSADDALELLEELRTDGEEVAVIIAVQIMPGMKGVDLLELVGEQLDLLQAGPLALDEPRQLALRLLPLAEGRGDLARGLAHLGAAEGVEQGTVLGRPLQPPLVGLPVDRDEALAQLGQDADRRASTTHVGSAAAHGGHRAAQEQLRLVGDAADGYPGIAGIGAVSAARMLNRYGAIETFPPDVLGPRREAALLFKKLATLRDDAPLFDTVAALRWQGPQAKFREWAIRMDAENLVARCDKIVASLRD